MAVTMPPGYRYEVLTEVDSTNDEARRRAEAGDGGALWLRAVNQTRGRGRRRRSWQSAEGDLMCTLLLRPACTVARSGELSFVAALALFDALAKFVSPEVLSLKWPNDVLLYERKTAGILLESEAKKSTAVDWVAIGIGVNLVSFPEALPFPATSLAAEGYSVRDPDTVLTALAGSMATWLDRWRDQGFAGVRETWLKRAHGLGEAITVRLSDETFQGRFITVNDTGALEVGLADGTSRVILSGDVFYVPAGE